MTSPTGWGYHSCSPTRAACCVWYDGWTRHLSDQLHTFQRIELQHRHTHIRSPTNTIHIPSFQSSTLTNCYAYSISWWWLVCYFIVILVCLVRAAPWRTFAAFLLNEIQRNYNRSHSHALAQTYFPSHLTIYLVNLLHWHGWEWCSQKA